MSHNTNTYLKLCQELKNRGIEFEIEAGVRLGRGFADVGFEEFYLLSENKMVSIYLGTVTEFRKEQSGFFFVVPETEELLDCILRKNIELDNLKFNSDTGWSCDEYQSDNLNILLINILLDIK